MNETGTTTVNDLPLNQKVRLLSYNEDGLVALEKPSRAMSHPNQPKDKKRALLVADYDLEGEFYFWTDDAGVLHKAWLINRLDSPTSGVILLGLNPMISKEIKHLFASRKVSKTYYAIVRGKPNLASGIWADKLMKDVHRGKNLIKKGQVVPAKTRIQAIKSPPGGFPVTLLKLMPLTGRTHQLRVQCKKHGLPIVGDKTYGSFSFNREVAMLTETKRMMLHSAEIHVHYAYNGEIRDFSAKSELPEEFDFVLGFRPGLNIHSQKNSRSPVLSGRRFKT